VCTLCPGKRDQDFCHNAFTKLVRFSWNLVCSFLNTFAAKSCKRCPPFLHNVSTLPGAGFTLSGDPVQKKCGRPFTYFSSKNWRPFISVITVRVSAAVSPEKLATVFLLITLVHSGVSPIISVFRPCKKFAAPFVGPPFCGGPCSA